MTANPEEEPKHVEPRFKLVSTADLLQWPSPRWLVDRVLLENCLAVLFGAPGDFKSFLALDLALHLASGLDWHERTVEAAVPVVYVAGEGGFGLQKRVRVWLHYHGKTQEELAGFRVVSNPVRMLEHGEVDEFIKDVQEQLDESPKLLILDTLARCLEGGDENISRDMSKFIAGVDAIRQKFGASVLVVHHEGKSRKEERGSSALRGAADLMIRSRKSSSGEPCAFVDFVKVKDFEPPPSLAVRFRAVEAEEREESSLVVVGLTETKPLDQSPHYDEFTLVQDLVSNFDEDGATDTQWKEVARCPRSSYYGYKKRLIEKGYVERCGPRRGGRFVATEKGEKAALVSVGPR